MISGCSKESKIERHWKKGETYFSENKLKEAVIEYKNIIQLEPKHSKAYYKLGMAYLKMGLLREGYASLIKTVEINPDMVEARNQLGGLYLLSKDTKKAREQAEFILAKDAKILRLICF
ncbi:MAG: tetratricopeptide repeat protein [Desulfobacterales bacterium]|nr:tetratricopeptide repeat protein [Desulfobacterales bacterium]